MDLGYMCIPSLTCIHAGHMRKWWKGLVPVRVCCFSGMPDEKLHLGLSWCRLTMARSLVSGSPMRGRAWGWDLGIRGSDKRMIRPMWKGSTGRYRKSVWTEYRGHCQHSEKQSDHI